jgi:hypothetical protein
MAKKDATGWDDLTIVDKQIGKVRGSYGSIQFTLSGAPEPEWKERFRTEVESNTATANMRPNAGPSVDGEYITWEVYSSDIEAMWEVVKPAVAAANEAYAKVYESRQELEAKVQARLDEQVKVQEEFEKKVKALK